MGGAGMSFKALPLLVCRVGLNSSAGCGYWAVARGFFVGRVHPL